jgi:prepilin-type N-terminal cleavage/methylation domain-containing protein
MNMVRSDLRTLRRSESGFTLVELLIVVIILAILAAIVVPQFVASSDDAKMAALDSNLRNFRSAVALYNQQHGEYPGALTDGTNPANSEAAFVTQLTTFTTDAGVSSATKTATAIYGPYITRSSMPTDPVHNVATVEVIGTGSLPLVATGTGGGWKFDTATGQFVMNDTGYDDR